MAEFTEIIKIRDRMHETVKCRDCRLSEKNNGYNCGCHAFALNHPEEYERICLDWAKENPETTNYDKFKEIFGFRPYEY